MSHAEKTSNTTAGEAAPDPAVRTENSKRATILAAAGKVFLERGFDAATTLEIAGQAKMSKRTLYEHFPSKAAMLAALIESGSRPMHAPPEGPLPKTRNEFLAALHEFGLKFLRGLVEPRSIAMYRLAITEAQRSGHVAKELYRSGREPAIQAVLRILRHGAEEGFCKGSDVDVLLTTFFNVLVGPMQMGLLLGVDPQPTQDALRARADLAIRVIARLTE
jgi:AcrR family transcriptional regulator